MELCTRRRLIADRARKTLQKLSIILIGNQVNNLRQGKRKARARWKKWQGLKCEVIWLTQWLLALNSEFPHPVQEGRAGDAEDLGRLNFISLLHF